MRIINIYDLNNNEQFCIIKLTLLKDKKWVRL